MIRIYAICTKQAHAELKQCFHPQYGSHFIDLPDGRIFLQANFGDHSGETTFCSHPDVEVLPDPALQGKEPLDPRHQKALAHLQPEDDTVLGAARAAAKIHPLMRLRAWL